METARVSTIIRLRPDVMAQAKRRAKKEKLSFNAYVEKVLDRETRLEWPVLPPDYKVSEEILQMSGCIPMPSREEIEADPRLAHILGESVYED